MYIHIYIFSFLREVIVEKLEEKEEMSENNCWFVLITLWTRNERKWTMENLILRRGRRWICFSVNCRSPASQKTGSTGYYIPTGSELQLLINLRGGGGESARLQLVTPANELKSWKHLHNPYPLKFSRARRIKLRSVLIIYPFNVHRYENAIPAIPSSYRGRKGKKEARKLTLSHFRRKRSATLPRLYLLKKIE